MIKWMLLVRLLKTYRDILPLLLPLSGPDEECQMVNEELLPLKREMAEKAASKQLDSYGYYLYTHKLLRPTS